MCRERMVVGGWNGVLFFLVRGMSKVWEKVPDG